MNKKAVGSTEILAVAMGFLMVVAIFFSVMVFFRAGDVVDANALLEGEISSKQAELARVKELDANIEVLKKEHEASLLLMPKGATEDQIMTELQMVSAEYGCDLSGITFNSRTATGEFNTIDMTVELVGTYADLAEMMQKIGHQERFYKANSLDFSDAGDGMLGLTVNLSAYYTI